MADPRKYRRESLAEDALDVLSPFATRHLAAGPDFEDGDDRPPRIHFWYTAVPIGYALLVAAMTTLWCLTESAPGYSSAPLTPWPDIRTTAFKGICWLAPVAIWAYVSSRHRTLKFGKPIFYITVAPGVAFVFVILYASVMIVTHHGHA